MKIYQFTITPTHHPSPGRRPRPGRKEAMPNTYQQPATLTNDRKKGNQTMKTYNYKDLENIFMASEPTSKTKIKLADQTIEVKDIFLGVTCMTEDALNSYGFYPETLAITDFEDAGDVFEILRVRKIAFRRIEQFAVEASLPIGEAHDVAYKGWSDESWQNQDHEIKDELDLIDENIRRWREQLTKIIEQEN